MSNIVGAEEMDERLTLNMVEVSQEVAGEEIKKFIRRVKRHSLSKIDKWFVVACLEQLMIEAACQAVELSDFADVEYINERIITTVDCMHSALEVKLEDAAKG